MIRWATLCGLAGLLLATGLILDQGLAVVAGTLAAAGFGIVWASLLHLVPMAINARAWQLLLPGGRRPGLVVLTGIVWVREAVNGLLPVARVGGEAASYRLLRQRGVAAVPALASLVIDVTLSVLSQALFALLGVALLATRGGDGPVAQGLALGLVAAVAIAGLLVAVQHRGLFGPLGRLVGGLFGRRLAGLLGGERRLDRMVRQLYRRQARIIACVAWQLAGWVAGAGEIWLALYFLGHPVPAGDALIIEALAQALSSAAFVVPGALGVQEGGFVVIGGLVGLGPDLALALSLARRARDILIFVPGLLAWQAAEGRRLLARA